MIVAKWEPTPCYRDAYSVDTLSGLVGRKAGKCTFRPRFHPFLDVSSWLAKRFFLFFWGFMCGCPTLGGPGILGLAPGLFLLVSCRLSLSMLVGG